MASKKNRKDILIFFKNILERRFSEAERSIEAENKKQFGNSEFKKGYLNALEGILLSARSGDERDYFNQISANIKTMENYRNRFDALAKPRMQSSFDEGFFSIWADFIQYRLNKT